MATASVQSSQAVNIEDDTVTITCTGIVVQRAANVEASQSSNPAQWGERFRAFLNLPTILPRLVSPAGISVPSGKYWNVVQSRGSRFRVLRNDR